MSMPETTHFHLLKPEYSDDSDVQVINQNMELIDGALWGLSNYGSANAGKFMIIGNDGSISLLDVANASGGAF